MSLASTHLNDLHTLRAVGSEASAKHADDRMLLEQQRIQLEQQVDSLKVALDKEKKNIEVFKLEKEKVTDTPSRYILYHVLLTHPIVTLYQHTSLTHSTNTLHPHTRHLHHQEISSLRASVQKLEEKFHCNQVTLSTQREELKKLTKLEKELEMVGKRAECVTNDRDVLSDRSTELKAQLTALRNRIALAEKDRDALLVQNVELEMELNALSKRAAIAEKEREESASRSWFRRAIVEEKAVTQTKYDHVMQDLSTAHAEIAEYKRQVIEMTMKRIDEEGTISYNPHLPNSQPFLLALIRLYMIQPYKNTPS